MTKKLLKPKVCPNCQSEMMGVYSKYGKKINSNFTCLVCNYSIKK